MASPDPQLDDLLRRLRSGQPEAAEELIARYGDYLRAVVRRRLHHRLRSVYDSLDFVQSVWASFLQAPPAGRDLADPDVLTAYLARIARNKVGEVCRQRFQTAKHAAAREVSLAAWADGPGDRGPVSRRDPTPSQAAIAGEHWERLKEGQSPEVQQVLELLRQGHTHREVADRMRLHPKMIQRLVQKLSRRVDLS
jgi:RNA polymerase sigma-70 factor (ECF subfamily)